MSFFAHISLRILGQTVTLTSPRWALRRSSISVRDWPMPPPMDERNLVVEDRLVVGQAQEVQLIRHFELRLQGFGGDADAHGSEFVAALCDRVPDQNVAVEAMRVFAGLSAWCR